MRQHRVWYVKACPICKTKFKTFHGKRGDKKTCSYACSNTYFRSGANNGNQMKRQRRIDRGALTYSEICWLHHEKRCVVCEETLVVEAHHHNENHLDNRPENFVPLCPTHHQYWHSRHRHIIKTKVETYVRKFTERASSGEAVSTGSNPLAPTETSRKLL